MPFINMTVFCGLNIDSTVCCKNLPNTASVVDETSADSVRRNKAIELQLAKDRDNNKDTMKILLLGGPESGKSTIFKQMRILHMNGFTDVDIINYRFLVYSNVIQAMHQLLFGARLLKIVIDLKVQPEVENFMTYIRKTCQNEYEISPELGLSIQKIYAAPFMKLVLEKHHEFTLLDSAIYFLDNIQRIAAYDFAPSTQDILRSRVQTTGIVEVEFKYRNYKLRLVDVGGQKSEQRKWIHCFDNVHGILFVADISGYMQSFDENGTKINRLKYNLKLFVKILLNQYFSMSTAFLLFFNKVDIFKERCEHYPLNSCFKTYSGKNTFDEMSAYIKDRFIQADSRNEIIKNPIYAHFTNATDTNLMDHVFESCMAAVIKFSMSTAALT